MSARSNYFTLYRGPIRRRIKDADKQIKLTKPLLNMPDAKGVLFVAHDGDYSIGVDAVLNLIYHSLNGGQYSNIDDIIYVNGNMAANLPDGSQDWKIFLRASRKEDRAIPMELVQRLGTEWGMELENLAGGKLPTIFNPPNQRQVVDSFRYQRPPRKT
jgi:hypothetical protein